MRDVAPPRPVAVDVDRVGEQLPLRLEPELLEPLRCELALVAPLVVNEVLETVHRYLPEDGGDGVLDPARQEVEPPAGVVLELEEPLERERLAEDRCRLGGRERRVRVEEPERLRERAVQTVAELVGEREDRTPVAGEVHEDVRVHARNGGRAESARPLVVAHRSVDPALGEEPLGDVPRLLREVRVRLDDDVARLVPGDLARILADRSEAVVVRDPVEPDELRLQRVVALHDAVAGDGRIDQRLHGLVRRVVSQVPGRDPGRIATQAVVDPFVDEDRVEDERTGAESGRESFRDRLGGRAADVAIAGIELRHRFLERGLLAVELHAQRTQKLLVQAAPGTDAGDGLLGDDLLLGLRQEIRAELPQRAQPVAPALELRAREMRLGRSVVEVGDLQTEEEQLRVERCALLRDSGNERAARRVGHVRCEVEMGEVADASEDLLDPLALCDRRGQLGRAQLRDLAVVRLAKGGGGLFRLLDVSFQSWIVTALVEVGEVPRNVFCTGQFCSRHGLDST